MAFIALGLLVCLHLAMCLRTARLMSRIGKNALAWFAISCLATVIPAMIVLMRHASGLAGDKAVGGPSKLSGAHRCPHCQAVLPAYPAGRPVVCLRCKMPVDEVYLA